jgi:LuxR family maltose regulon positive regulatory protein
LIAQALYELLTSGHVVLARGWLERLPESIVLGNDQLRLVSAWSHALSHEPREAFPLTEPLIGPHVDPALRYEALQVRAAVARHADDLVAAAEAGELIEEVNPSVTPVVRAANVVLRSMLALSRGDTVGARMELAKVGLPASDARETYANYYAEFSTGLSYLLDARPQTAAHRLEQALSRATSACGARSPPACLVAAALAAALWEQDETDAAEATLANRLDVIERTAVPEAIALAYVSRPHALYSTVATSDGVNDLAEGLYALGGAAPATADDRDEPAEVQRVEASSSASARARAIALARAARDVARRSAAWERSSTGCGCGGDSRGAGARAMWKARASAVRLLRPQSTGRTRGRLEVLAPSVSPSACAADRPSNSPRGPR